MSDRDDELAGAVASRDAGRLDEARDRLCDLAARYPDDGEVAYHAAWAHDRLGLEAEAVGFYERALASGGLSPDDRHGARVGLGSTYTVLGRTDDARRVLAAGLAERPGDGALTAFAALADHHAGDHRAAVGRLLRLLATTSDDPGVRRYRRALDHYATELLAR